MKGEPRSALVVLHAGLDPNASAERSGETPPDAVSVERVISWFRDRGFETGPFVGISFAVTGGEELFQDVLGDAASTSETGTSQQFSLDGLDADVAPLVAAIVVPSPPEFGPWNP